MADMTTVRDPKNDSLLTPQNAVLALIDYQPEQYAGVASVGHKELLAHVTMLGRVATTFEIPVVLSTVYVKHGMSGTNEELLEALPGVPKIDRTTMNSWEDPEFRAAIERSGRKKLIIASIEDPAVIRKILAHLNKKIALAEISLLPDCRASPSLPMGLFD